MAKQIDDGYIAEMARELANLARQRNLIDLAQILDIAVLEAELTAKRPLSPSVGAGRLTLEPKPAG